MKRRECQSCRHYRRTQPEPFSASDLRNPQVMGEELGKWKEHLGRIQQKERMEARRGATSFTFEPWFFAWCGHYSSPGMEQAGAGVRSRGGVYLLAEAVNEDGDCPAFEAAVEEKRQGEGPPW